MHFGDYQFDGSRSTTASIKCNVCVCVFHANLSIPPPENPLRRKKKRWETRKKGSIQDDQIRMVFLGVVKEKQYMSMVPLTKKNYKMGWLNIFKSLMSIFWDLGQGKQICDVHAVHMSCRHKLLDRKLSSILAVSTEGWAQELKKASTVLGRPPHFLCCGFLGKPCGLRGPQPT